jgi:hypothetical protein
MGDKKDVVLEVQSVKHEIKTTIKKEVKDGKKH